MQELMVIENLKPVDLFTPVKMDEFINQFTKSVESFAPIIDTVKGRKDIISLAAKVGSTKTVLETLGKDFVAEKTAEVAAVNQQRKKMRDSLDALRIKTRLPVTEYQEREKERKEKLQCRLKEITVLRTRGSVLDLDSISIQATINNLEKIQLDISWDEELETATNLKEQAIILLTGHLGTRKEFELQQEEIARLKKVEVDNIAKEKFASDERARLARVAQKKIDDEKLAAELKEFERLEAAELKSKIEREEMQAEIDVANKKTQDEKDKREALEFKAKQDKEAIENKRIAKEAADKRRQDNEIHVTNIENMVCEHLIKHADIDLIMAHRVMQAIKENKIPRVTIKY